MSVRVREKREREKKSIDPGWPRPNYNILLNYNRSRLSNAEKCNAVYCAVLTIDQRSYKGIYGVRYRL